MASTLPTRAPLNAKMLAAQLKNENGAALYIVLAGIVVCLLMIGGLYFYSSPFRWRAQLVALKVRGALSDLSWRETLHMLRRGNPSLDANMLAASENVYLFIKNTYTSSVDISSGATLFNAHCASCHGSEGRGGTGPDLRQGNFRRGASDFALFRTIFRGVPNTGMPGIALPEKAVWQVVAFVKSLNTGQTVDPKTMVATPNITYETLLKAENQSRNWLTYSGSYKSHRYSHLDQIKRENVQRMKLKWALQMQTAETRVKATPLVVDDTMYVTEPPNDVLALDSGTARQIWSYRRSLPEQMPLCCGRANNGLAVSGDSLYMGTLDAHLVSLDATTGRLRWDVEVADYRNGYSITAAPLAVKDKVITGVAGGEFGIRGFIDAYDAKSGKRVWRFYTIPGPDERGHETWAGDSWKTGGSPTWMTGSYDPELNLLYWGVGNPGPVYQGDSRSGSNLYSNSVVALDADTGKLIWYFQFTPHDEHDWDSNQIPVLVDAPFRGKNRRLLLTANKNGFYYVLDRETGEFLLAGAFTKQSWAERIDSTGKPIVKPGSAPSREGSLVWPGYVGGTNWWSPSYSVRTGLFYVPTWESANIFFKGAPEYVPGQPFSGSTALHAPAIQQSTSIKALVAQTGEIKWEHKFPVVPKTAMGGILSTVGDLVFLGNADRFYALDAFTGAELWKFNAGGEIVAAPITYLNRGRQQITIAAGRALFTFGLDEVASAAMVSSRNRGR